MPASCSVVAVPTSIIALISPCCIYAGLPWWFSDEESAYSAGDLGSIPGSGRSPGEGNGKPLQCSCLGNPMDRGAWQATVHGVTKESDTTEHLNKTTLRLYPRFLTSTRLDLQWERVIQVDCILSLRVKLSTYQRSCVHCLQKVTVLGIRLFTHQTSSNIRSHSL